MSVGSWRNIVEFGEFNVNGIAEMTVTQAYIDVQARGGRCH